MTDMIKCDICGIIKTNGFETREFHSLTIKNLRTDIQATYDLCEQCTNEIKKMVNHEF